MTMGKILAASAAIVAMFATPQIGVDGAQAKTRAHHGYAAQRYAGGQYRCPVHRTVDGTLVDCNGWRLRSNATGWDNTCLNLDYLPSMYACNSNRR